MIQKVRVQTIGQPNIKVYRLEGVSIKDAKILAEKLLSLAGVSGARSLRVAEHGREDEEGHVGEVAALLVVARHVADRVPHDQPADAGDDQHHHGRERIDEEREADDQHDRRRHFHGDER